MPTDKTTLNPSESLPAKLNQANHQVMNLPRCLAESDEPLNRRSTELDGQISPDHDFREEVARLERINQESCRARQQSENAFHLRLGVLEDGAAQNAALLASRTADLTVAQAEIKALSQRLSELQDAGPGALEERCRALETADREQLNKLHIQLAHKQLLAESRALENDDRRRQIDTLRTQLALLENVNEELTRQQGEFATQHRYPVAVADRGAQVGTAASAAQAGSTLGRSAENGERRSLVQRQYRRWRFSLATKRRWKHLTD